jgi:hypothetical protein
VSLRAFRQIPRDEKEWAQWIQQQDVVSGKRGSATFDIRSTVSVVFDVAEQSTDYTVTVTGNKQETFWVTDKAKTGFLLNSSNASSIAIVDWILLR